MDANRMSSKDRRDVSMTLMKYFVSLVMLKAFIAIFLNKLAKVAERRMDKKS